MAETPPLRGRRRLDPAFGRLLTELQSVGVRLEEPVLGRRGGAGPSDAGMVLVDGVPLTFPFASDYTKRSPYTLRTDDEGWAIYRDGQVVARAEVQPRPRYYELTTAEGVPYSQIALLHLDSLASTVLQTCTYWGTPDQCTFCAIEVTLERGATIARKTPEQLAEVAVAARDLDGAVDVTLTTGSTKTPDRGAMYVARCGQAVKQASGLPVQVQFEPPRDLDVLDDIAAMGIDSVGIHVETMDPDVLARVAPGKARTGIEGYFTAWERAVAAFGPGQVSTYVILGMGEDPELTARQCRRAVDMGVYPFLVPLRPVPGSLMEEWEPPAARYVESMYRQVVPYVVSRGLASWDVQAGCARCQACSAMSAFEVSEDADSGRRLPVLGVR